MLVPGAPRRRRGCLPWPWQCGRCVVSAKIGCPQGDPMLSPRVGKGVWIAHHHSLSRSLRRGMLPSRARRQCCHSPRREKGKFFSVGSCALFAASRPYLRPPFGPSTPCEPSPSGIQTRASGCSGLYRNHQTMNVSPSQSLHARNRIRNAC